MFCLFMTGLPGMDLKDFYFNWYDNNGNGIWDEGDEDKDFTTDPKYDGIEIPMFLFKVITK